MNKHEAPFGGGHHLGRRLTDKFRQREKEEEFAPRLIPGLDTELTKQRIQNLNANVQIRIEGAGRTRSIAVCEPDERHDMTFHLSVSPAAVRKLRRADPSERHWPPFLITALSYNANAVPSDMIKYVTDQARRHNAAKAVTFLNKGGDRSSLPFTNFMPDDETLAKFLKEA